MKKIIPLLIIGTLVLSGLGAVAISENIPYTHSRQETESLTTPILNQIDNELSVQLNEATSYNMEPGKPILPVVTKQYIFPLGTKINEVTVTFSDVTVQKLTMKISPATNPQPITTSTATKQPIKTYDSSVYSSAQLYPIEEYTTNIGVGLRNLEHVVYLNVRCNPVRYSPAENMLYSAQTIDIDVKYTPPETPIVFEDVYDLLIIAPEAFEAKLQKLIDHKESMGVKTVLETVENIYSNYEGRDEPEQIKYFIYDAIDPDGLNWGINYVLLVGGRKGQTFKWYLPERRTYCDDGGETGYSSDLYFADVWKYDEDSAFSFEDWDSNGNDVIAEYIGFSRDIMDFYPEVYVGRLACRYKFEVDTVINKIIKYETSAEDSWFKKGAVIAGDTFPNSLPYFEGEMETELTAGYLEEIGFDVERAWTSDEGSIQLEQNTSKDQVAGLFNSGVGMVHFAGHGNPSTWSTHPSHDDETWVTGLNLKTMIKNLNNGDKLPFVLVGGCHNSQFNVTMMKIVAGILKYGRDYFHIPTAEDPFLGPFYLKNWVPRDWSWELVAKRGGGAIAAVGMSGFGWGSVNNDSTSDLGGWIEPRFFHAYANQSLDILGEAHGRAIEDYITILGGVNSNNLDRKTIDAWVLLGDPSLKLGGY